MAFQRAAFVLLLLSHAAAAAAPSWPRVSVLDFGAVGDNATDNTAALRAALAFVKAAGGGEVVVPAPGVFKSGPFNLSSNVRLTVDGTIFGIEDASLFPRIADLPSYDDMNPRCHPLVWAVDAANVSVAGVGVINGAGPYWWPRFLNDTARPHLMEMLNVTGLEISGVTMLNSGFWTLHPVYSRDVHIHGINITTPWCEDYKCANTDGIDVDSTSDVLIEDSYISCGDDHVTVISGAGVKGRAFAMPSRNVTVRRLTLGLGMGLSIGSSVSGGVEDVVYEYNVMTELASDWGQGTHLKTASARGGYVNNITWQHSVFNVVSSAGIEVETDYQSGAGGCDASTCTAISNLLWRNLTFNAVGSPGSIRCFPPRPCVNLTFESVHVNSTEAWSCSNVTAISVTDVTPPGLAAACGFV
jgi:polygalacturonase